MEQQEAAPSCQESKVWIQHKCQIPAPPPATCPKPFPPFPGISACPLFSDNNNTILYYVTQVLLFQLFWLVHNYENLLKWRLLFFRADSRSFWNTWFLKQWFISFLWPEQTLKGIFNDYCRVPPFLWWMMLLCSSKRCVAESGPEPQFNKLGW